jgi:hypothetical protein
MEESIMRLTKSLFFIAALMLLAACSSYGPSRYDGHDAVVRSARAMQSASANYYERVQREAGYDQATRDAGELAIEADNFHRRVSEQPADYPVVREDFEELSQAYALAQNELATRSELNRHSRIVEGFRDVEVAFANLNDAIEYNAGHYYDRDRVGYRDDYR